MDFRVNPENPSEKGGSDGCINFEDEDNKKPLDEWLSANRRRSKLGVLNDSVSGDSALRIQIIDLMAI